MQPRHAWTLLQQMGPGWVVQRAGYELRRRSGLLRRRTRERSWDAYGLSTVAPGWTPARVCGALRTSAFRLDPARAVAAVPADARARLLDDVERSLRGECRFFDRTSLKVGWPPRWHRHPTTGSEWSRVHWTQLDDRAQADVKWLWEMGRFGIAYSLVRAHAVSADERYAEAFWTLVASWREHNLPNIGVHWMCGQECAFRSLAWTFALLSLLDAPSTSVERVASLVEMIAAHAERIAANIDYARSQKNNHAVNEALALWIIGTVFPMLRGSARWASEGRTILETEAARQIYDDGAYVQQSLGYHRLILESYGWALEWGQRSGRPFAESLHERVRNAALLLYQLLDPVSGALPNYGSNDGSRLMKLDGCDPTDARPAVVLALWAAGRRRVFAAGGWDEPVGWLSQEPIAAAAPAPVSHVDLSAPDGGYYTLRGADTWAFLRCCAYADRPAQADMLHVDVWWRGHNVIADPGTYSYSDPPPWNNGLASTRVHNTPTVDGLDQMERGGRFVWLHWNEGRVVSRETLSTFKRLDAQQNGYGARAGVSHRRTVALAGDRVWVVIDDLNGAGTHDVSAQWLLPDAVVESADAGRLVVKTPPGNISMATAATAGGTVRTVTLTPVAADPSSVLGWFSPTYQCRVPALGAQLALRGVCPMRIITVIGLGIDARIDDVQPDAVRVSAAGESWTLAHRHTR